MSTERYAVFTVCDRGENKKPFWLRIGTMWPNRNNAGFRIQFDALPLTDSVVVMPDEPREQREGQGNGGQQQQQRQPQGNGNARGQQRRAAPPQQQQDDFDYNRGPAPKDDEIPF